MLFCFRVVFLCQCVVVIAIFVGLQWTIYYSITYDEIYSIIWTSSWILKLEGFEYRLVSFPYHYYYYWAFVLDSNFVSSLLVLNAHPHRFYSFRCKFGLWPLIQTMLIIWIRGRWYALLILTLEKSSPYSECELAKNSYQFASCTLDANSDNGAI